MRTNHLATILSDVLQDVVNILAIVTFIKGAKLPKGNFPKGDPKKMKIVSWGLMLVALLLSIFASNALFTLGILLSINFLVLTLISLSIPIAVFIPMRLMYIEDYRK
ncbi:MAG: hypothetical protein ACTHW8_15015 [Sphingobacterium sp.]